MRKFALKTAYNRGRAFEYRVQRELTANVGTVLRSAGSHSPVDLVWLSRSFDRPRGIQCKVADMYVPARKDFYQWCEQHGLLPLLATKIRGGFKLERVLENGALVELA